MRNTLIWLCVVLLLPTTYLTAQSYHDPSPNQFDADAFYHRGTELHRLNDLSGAISYYTEALYINPQHTDALYNRGIAYYDSEKYNKALFDFDALIELRPQDGQAFEQRARTKLLLNDGQGAMADYTRALEGSPTSILFVNRGMASSMLKNYHYALQDFDEALQMDPNDAEAYINKGDIYFALEDYHNAIQYYTQALFLSPDDERTYNNRANAYMKLNNPEQALLDYNVALDIDPNSYTYVNRGFYWLDQNQRDRAEQDFMEASRLDIRNASAYYGLGMVKLEKGELSAAYQNFSTAIRYNPENELFFNFRALVLHEQKKYTEAIEDTDIALQLNPQLVDAYSNRAMSYYLLGQEEQAFSDLQQALALNPQHAIARNRLELLRKNTIAPPAPNNLVDHVSNDQITSDAPAAINYHTAVATTDTYYLESTEEEPDDYEYTTDEEWTAWPSEPNPETNEPQSAADIFIPKSIPEQRATVEEAPAETNSYLLVRTKSTAHTSTGAKVVAEVEPQDASFLLGRAMSFLKVNQYVDALADFDQLLIMGEEKAQIYNGRGIAHYRLGQQREAIEDFSRAIQLDAGLVEAYYNRANLYYDLRNTKRAIADFSRAIELSPDFAGAYYMRGVCYSNLKKYKIAEADFNYCLLLDPQHARALNNRATILLATGNVFEAIKDYNQAIALQPLDARLYANRAKARERMKLYDAALEDCQTALRLESDNDEWHFLAGVILYETGHFAEAEAKLNQAIELRGQDLLATYFYRRALIYHHQNKLQQALQDYSQTIELNPAQAEAFYNRALVQVRMGQMNAACEDFYRAESHGLVAASQELKKRKCR